MKNKLTKNIALSIASVFSFYFLASAYMTSSITSLSFMNRTDVGFAKRFDDSNEDLIIRSVASSAMTSTDVRGNSDNNETRKPYVEKRLDEKLVNGKWIITRIFTTNERFDDEVEGKDQILALGWLGNGDVKITAALENVATSVSDFQNSVLNKDKFKVSFFNFETRDRMALFKEMQNGYLVVELKKVNELVVSDQNEAEDDVIRFYKLESVQVNGNVFRGLDGELRFGKTKLDRMDTQIPGSNDRIIIESDQVGADQFAYEVRGVKFTASYYRSENSVSITLLNGEYAQYNGQPTQIKFTFMEEGRDDVANNNDVNPNDPQNNMNAQLQAAPQPLPQAQPQVQPQAQVQPQSAPNNNGDFEGRSDEDAERQQYEASEDRAAKEMETENERQKMIDERGLDEQRMNEEMQEKGVNL